MSVTLRKRKLPSGKVELRLDIYHYGKRRFESLGLYLNGDKLHNREVTNLAEIIRAKRELEIQSSANGIIPPSKKKQSFTAFLEKLGSSKNRKETQANYRNVVQHLRTYVKGELYFAELDKTVIEGFKDYLLEHFSQNSAWKYLSIVKSGLSKAIRDGMINTNPAYDVRIKLVDSLPKFLTFEEVQSLSNTQCANKNVKNAFLFSCFSGLRYSDVVKLRWDDISGGCVTFRQQKTKQSERLYLSRQALRILEGQKTLGGEGETVDHQHSDLVFPLPRQSSVDKALKRWAMRAGLNKSISFHRARHTFATLSLSYGIDIYTVSKLLGHRHLETTLIYAKVIDEKKRQAVDLLPEL